MKILPDVAAMIDVLADLGESSDSMTVEEAVALRESMVELRKKAGEVLGLADTQLVTVLESPREFDGQLYEIKSDGKWRPLHHKIDAAVKDAAMIDRSTGEKRSASAAVDVAIGLMSACYVAPSTFPKTGALDALGLDKDDVGLLERAGKKVSVTEVKQ
jgi:hypothetical protein